MEKGNFVELNITDMSNEGAGIGHDESGMTVFVTGCVAGDKVRAGITDVKKNFAKAKAVQILEESKDRAEDVCPYIDSCGGCGYGKLKYDAQLALKEKSVRDKLVRLAGIENPKVNPIIPSELVTGYRDKATIAVYDKTVGFKEKKSNRVVDCKECRIQHPLTMIAAECLRKFVADGKAKGIIDIMVVRITTTGEMMAIVNRIKGKDGRIVKKDLDWEKLALMIDDATDHSLESFYVDDKWIAGKHTILESLETLDGQKLDFEISPLSFYQVNPTQMLKLYDKAREKADFGVSKGNAEGNQAEGVSSKPILLDLYCGVGTIGIFLAKYCQMVYGIESVRPAVLDANRNSVINGIVNTRYILGKAEEELPGIMGMAKLYKYNEVNEIVEREPEIRLSKVDCAIVDPPRSGCDTKLLDAVIKASPERIVYVSCDPATLARDIKYLTNREGRSEASASGSLYEFIDATPVDMFPQTTHVETVVLLSRTEK